ncbi:MAG: DUF262 domain-containing protein [Eubacterium sp.]|nr:DUF262 domain-containing protein [Eubacterium sp.]
MGYNPNDSTIGKVLNNNVIYDVPRYQRNYVWDKSNWQQLYEDINSIYESESEIYHFIGSFIFENYNDNCIIIDGQQRLTTILILLAIICKHQKILKDMQGFNTTKSYCILQSDEGEKTRICNDDHSILSIIVNNYCIGDNAFDRIEDYFRSVGNKISAKERRFYECFRFFNEIITCNLNKRVDKKDKIKYLQDFRNAIIKTRVISIVADKEQEGYIIFEILNSRGIPLEDHELLKNYVFMCCRNNAENDMPKELWNNISSNTSSGRSASLKSFLSQYTALLYGKDASKKPYRTLREQTARQDVYNLLVDLEKKSNYYYNICNVPNEIYTEKIRYCLEFFNKFGISIIRPVLLSLFEAYDDGKLSNKVLEDTIIKIKNFLSVFVVVCQQKTNKIEDIIYNSAKTLHCGFTRETLNAFITSLFEKKPTYEMFMTSLGQINYSNKKELYDGDYKPSKKHCEYILREMELFLSHSDDYVLTKFTIEHIKPDSQGGKANLVGNMIPLAKALNKNAKDKSVKEKISYYEKSTFALTHAFIERYKQVGKWDDSNVEETIDYYGKMLYRTIWI